MRLQVDYADGSVSGKIYHFSSKDFSKTQRVKTFRSKVSLTIDIPINKFDLIFQGKVLTDQHTDESGSVEEALLHNYGIEERHTLQVRVKLDLDADVKDEKKINLSSGVNGNNEEAATNCIEEDSNSSESQATLEPTSSQFFNVGELVDAKNVHFQGAWMEAKIIGIFRKTEEPPQPSSGNEDAVRSNIHDLTNSGDSLIYSVEFESDETKAELPLNSIRPRARQKVTYDKVTPGSKIMVNYNTDDSTKIGHYYDMIVNRKSARRLKYVIGTVFFGVDDTALQDCKIHLVDEMYIIEDNVLLADRDATLNELMLKGSSLKRLRKPECSYCQDRPDVTCRECSCSVCGGKDEPHQQIVCDQCQECFHLWCLNPKLDSVPEGDWFCASCKNKDDIRKPGQKGKSKKNSRGSMKSSTRDWGKGMACAGRTKECTIVPMDHFGPIPGIVVGMSWQYRILASEAGVHRPPVGGIHGREEDGAYSIALSGGYEDDLDEGDTFYYTGSGGRDLGGNKRTAEQSCDQVLTDKNQALAKNCAAPLNDKEGAEAKDWRSGNPIRVLRGFKGFKHSKYCPEKGYRYDGIYKVVKYWPQKGRSGFRVWRFLLRRDDPTPAPWTEEGKKIMENLGIKMQMLNESEFSQTNEESEEKPSSKNRKRKRSPQDSVAPEPKKNKPVTYVPPKKVAAMMSVDSINEKIWEECSSFYEKGELEFKKKVMESFNCLICQDFVTDPVTLNCSHSFCLTCVKRQLSVKQYECVHCRDVLRDDFQPTINEMLREILRNLIR